MKKCNNYILDSDILSDILNIINTITDNISITFEELKLKYDKITSYLKTNRYSSLICFENFYFLTYFDKIFIFTNLVKFDEIKQIISKEEDFKNFINGNAIGLIVRGKLLSNNDFNNLKKCYMLTQNIIFKDDKVFCKYKPYYLIELELAGKTLTITINVSNSQCELNMDNVTTDLKTFLNLVFQDMDKSKFKIHHEILQYYASLD